MLWLMSQYTKRTTLNPITSAETLLSKKGNTVPEDTLLALKSSLSLGLQLLDS